ncbi:lipoyl(octanoyl) transferase [Powellomyces hirtus]|uniref:lipoyl(octanoyl) transferase n=1 Tax=Powellomyces hirtus TaxID=109895 RepID=A0A507EC75_9FUNG|nr:lipoyl(octanoyl) transferase [Powellomyces hirtus]
MPNPRRLYQTARGYATTARPPTIATKYLSKPIAYETGLALQDHLVQQRQQQLISNVLLLLQHPPTYTAGRRVRGSDVTEGERLRALGAQYFETLRGGQTTFHGPGQLVGYPILSLPEFKLGVRTYITHLEKTLIQTLKQYDISAKTTCDTGVWVSDRKIAALGIQVRRHVTSHGFALNCNTGLDWFSHIVPCGLVGKGVTSITEELQRVTESPEVTVETVLPHLISAFGDTFGAATAPLDEVDPSVSHEIDEFIRSRS